MACAFGANFCQTKREREREREREADRQTDRQTGKKMVEEELLRLSILHTPVLHERCLFPLLIGLLPFWVFNSSTQYNECYSFCF
jgi:hypothetical protein